MSAFNTIQWRSLSLFEELIADRGEDPFDQASWLCPHSRTHLYFGCARLSLQFIGQTTEHVCYVRRDNSPGL